MKKIFKTGLAVLMIATMSIGLLTGCGGDKPASGDNTPIQNEQQSNQKAELTINLNDYINIGYTGRDGQGYVSWNYDGWADEESYSCVTSRDLIEKLNRYTIGLYDRSTLEKTLEGNDNHGIALFKVVCAERPTNLSNGDTVHFTWKVNERGLRLLKEQVPGVNFVWEDFDDVVNGLEGVIEVDPFNCKNYEVMIDCWPEDSHLSGEAILEDWEVLIERRGDGSYGPVGFEVDTMGHTGAWKNGDQVKITITASDEYILEEFGIVLTEKTGIVTVYWLDEPNE